MKCGKMGRRAFFVLSAAVFAAAPVPALATDILWSNGAGGSFNVASNWIGHVVPGTGDVAHFQVVMSGSWPTYGVAFTTSQTIEGTYVHRDNVTWNLNGNTYTQTGIPGFDSFVVSQFAGENGLLTIENGTVVTGESNVASFETSIGEAAGASGTVTLFDGATWTDNSNERIGDSGTGNLIQIGGTHNVGSFTIGADFGTRLLVRLGRNLQSWQRHSHQHGGPQRHRSRNNQQWRIGQLHSDRRHEQPRLSDAEFVP